MKYAKFEGRRLNNESAPGPQLMTYTFAHTLYKSDRIR